MLHISTFKCTVQNSIGFLGASYGKESSCSAEFDPWVGKIPWRRAWQPTPVFLPGESHGQRSLVGCSPWGRKELHTAERQAQRIEQYRTLCAVSTPPRGCPEEPPIQALARPASRLPARRVRTGQAPGRSRALAQAGAGWARGGGNSGHRPYLDSRPGHLPSLCVCSAGRERKQDAFRWALGVPGPGGQLLGLAPSLKNCLLPSLYLPLSTT